MEQWTTTAEDAAGASGEQVGKVLVVEDEEELAELLRFNLQRCGFEVAVASDGLAACKLIGGEKPDLILLDLMLPLLSGWEICRMVRAHHDPRIAKTPIIMLSALGSVDDRIKGYDSGADLYLPKPYAIKEVMIKTGQLIEQHRENMRIAGKIEGLKIRHEQQDRWQQAMFHELLNQLTVISGIAEHLKSESAALPREESADFAGQIADSSHYLGLIAENYLFVRKFEENSGALKNEPLCLGDLLSETIRMFAPVARKKSCQVKLAGNSDVILDLPPVGLKIVLSNLLDNALKYSPAGGQVRLKVAEDATGVLVRIEDDGPGIPAAERSRVFERFYRGEGHREETPGTGLGLYMARTLARSMGGGLELAHNDSPGCRLELRLPTATGETPQNK